MTEQQANAALIAAAPELLAILKEVVQADALLRCERETCKFDHALGKAARAVIAKAEGR